MAKNRRKPSKAASRPAAAKKSAPKRDRGPTRDERIAAERAARRRRELRFRVLVALVVLLVVGGLAFRTVQGRRASERRVAAVTEGSCRFDRKSDPGGRTHVATPRFAVNPPTGGAHLASAVTPRSYQEPPEDGSLVHALEHGDIVIWYRPDISPESTAVLERIADRYSDDVLLVPRAQLPTPIAASGWHRRIQCQEAEERSLSRFVTQYRNASPEGQG